MTPNRKISKRPRQSKFTEVCNLFFRAFQKRADVEKAIVYLSLEGKYVLRRLSLLMPLALHISYGKKSLVVKIRYSELDSRKYLRRFTTNLFKCLISCGRFFQNNKIMLTDVPNTLFHGTTTKFLPEIEKQGLLPCKTGQCWQEDKDGEERVFLTDSLCAAEKFALIAAQKFGGEPLVLKVSIKGMKHMLKVGSEILRHKGSGLRVFNMYKEFFFTEPIPPNRIKDWYVLSNLPASMMLERIAN